MKWLDNMSEKIKRNIRTWLSITPASPYAIQINEVLDFELNAIRNRIWYRGDGNELEQMYQQNPDYADRYKFWASRCTPGMEMRKIHTGLPGLIVRMLASVTLADMGAFEFESGAQEILWKEIDKKNDLRKKLSRALRETLYIGDGAWKLTLDTRRSEYPILAWYPGDRVELVLDGDDLTEIIFKTPYTEHGQRYVLFERYGYGYVKNELYLNDSEVDLSTVRATAGLKDISFDSSMMLAVPFRIYDSAKWEGRGGSIFDGKLDSFDAFDEVWSQWMDALRAGRARTYIPEAFIPKNPETGEMLRPNAFDNRFIAGESDMDEGAKNGIMTNQPAIPHESYLASYITALDLCLQGIISPSTLGIDTKKLDNAEAQREKEKTTLYTRAAIVEALQAMLPKLIQACLSCYWILTHHQIEEVKVDIPFGEYANPSFESQVETVTKGKQGGVMSIEASVEELYGETKDDEWKQEEVARLKAEQGITDLEEPAVNAESGLFGIGSWAEPPA